MEIYTTGFVRDKEALKVLQHSKTAERADTA
jgi:hypothetical protein